MYEDFETMQMRAWPAEKETWFGAWRARFSRGFSNRANSATPLGGLAGGSGRIDAIEAAYRAEGIRPCFRLRDDPECMRAEAALLARGYEFTHPTLVKTVDLARALANLGRSPAVPDADPELEFTSGFGEGWVRAYAALNQRPAEADEYWRTLSAVRVSARTLIVRSGGRAVAAGSAIIDLSAAQERAGPWAGFYDLAVEASLRGRGLGRLALSALIADSAGSGIERGYLAVMEGNQAALGLYASAGFRDLYRYWYRRAPLTSP
jgi:N-acetylglutamate synthase